jgi:hypothetical protein
LKFALKVLDESGHTYVRDSLVGLSEKQPRWAEYVGSTNRRLARFLSDDLLEKFMAFRSGNLDIARLMSDDAVLLVNLAPSVSTFAEDAARVLASFLLGDFYRAALERPRTTQHFMLILDEFQEYVSPDTAGMLDAVRKGGLHLVMSHQRMGQLKDEQGANLREAINVNARIKAAFAVTDYDLAYNLAPQLAIEEMVADRVKDEIRLPVTTGFEYEPTVSRTHSESSSSNVNASHRVFDGEPTKVGFVGGGSAQISGDSVTHAFERVPIIEELVTSRTYYSIDEKRNIIAGRLMHQPPRRVTIRFGSELPEAYEVPETSDPIVRESHRAEYEAECMRISGAVRPEDAAAELARSRSEFLARVRAALRPPKKPTTSDPPRI